MESRDCIVEDVRLIIGFHLGVELGAITPKASLVDDLGADSLAMVELALALEEAFDIEISLDEVESMHRVADVERSVTQRWHTLMRRLAPTDDLGVGEPKVALAQPHRPLRKARLEMPSPDLNEVEESA